MTEYKIVPKVATDEMEEAGDGFCDHDGPCFCPETAYTAMLNAAPPPGEDLVERVARFFAGFLGDDIDEWEIYTEDALAILAEIGRKTDG